MLLATAVTAIAVNMALFNGWDNLIERSPDIFMARRPNITPLAATESTNHSNITATADDVTLCPIEVISTLKGNAKPGPAQLLLFDSSQRGDGSPNQGDMFLVFANNSEGNNLTNTTYHAVESYRIIKIASDIHLAAWTNALAGKPLKEQVKMIVQYRLDTLNEEFAKGQAEKKHLEDGLKELGK